MGHIKVTRGQKVAPQKLERARELRRDLTPQEKTLWQALRRDQQGVHFRRQQIIAGFIVDFYCAAAHLVIELDGGPHAALDQRAQDSVRDHVLAEQGLRVVRFRNREIEARLPEVLDKIRRLTRNREASEP